ncbi:glutamate receptor 2.7-like [Glycine soja]|uniref:glutamate receptor 2.7-like n=1 Tax=Glycine soja TaxID=3848 RepID=UPI0010388B21|nr:glutamate receptor 2.7-like [Glycine soja]
MHVIIHGNIAANESSDDKGIIGAILDKSSRIGQEHAVAMKLALEDFYQKSIQSFSLHIRNSQGDPLLAAIAAKDLIDNQKVQAIIGPQTWAETSLVAEISSQKRIPFLSLAEATPEWAMKKWHFLLQSSPSQIMQMKAIAEIVKSWKLYNITMIYEDGDSSSTKILSQLSEALTKFGTELSNAIAIPPLVSSSLSQQLEKLREGQCRVIIVHLSFPLALNLFETAKRMNIMGEGNVWITTGSFTSLVHSLNASTISNMQGVIGVKSYIPKLFPQYADFYRRFRKKFSSENFEEFNYEPGIFAAEAYDAARIVVDAMRETNQIGGQLLLDKIMLNEKASYSSSVKELGKVVNPTCAIRLRIGVPSMSNVKQYAEVIQDLSQNVPSFNFKGFSICLFDEIVKKLPYRLEYDYFAFNGTYDELVKQVYLKNYDAVVGDVSIVSTRYEYASFTQPYTETGLMMIVPIKSKTGDRTWLFMKPFTKRMWILILFIIVYNGFVVWIIERNHLSQFMNISCDLPILKGDNYKVWKERILLHLGWMDIDYAIKKDEPPAITETSKLDVVDLYERWERSNRLSVMFIKTNISASIRGSVDQHDKVRDLLKAIDEQFTTSEKLLASTLIMQFSSIKLTGTRGVREHIMRLRDIVAPLKTLEVTMSKSILGMESLRKLVGSEQCIYSGSRMSSHYTVPGSPDQNGVAERRNRSLLDMNISSEMDHYEAKPSGTGNRLVVIPTPQVKMGVRQPVIEVPQAVESDHVDQVVCEEQHDNVEQTGEEPVEQDPHQDDQAALRISTRVKRQQFLVIM